MYSIGQKAQQTAIISILGNQSDEKFHLNYCTSRSTDMVIQQKCKHNWS